MSVMQLCMYSYIVITTATIIVAVAAVVLLIPGSYSTVAARQVHRHMQVLESSLRCIAVCVCDVCVCVVKIVVTSTSPT